MKHFIYFLLLSACLISCEEEPVPMLDVNVPAGTKTVLIEDITGVKCANCPKGARTIADLVATYGKDRIIPIAIYSNSANLGTPYAESKYNFLTEEGLEIERYIDVLFGQPAAAINRVVGPQSNRLILLPPSWPPIVEEEINRPSELNMSITTNFDEDTRVLTGTVNFIPVNDINGPLNYTIILTESHLIDYQLDDVNIGLVTDYEHNHVFRKALTAPTGNPLGTSFSAGEIVTRDFSFTLPDEDGWWVAKNCEVVVFATLAGNNERRVLQAAKAYVTEQ